MDLRERLRLLRALGEERAAAPPPEPAAQRPGLEGLGPGALRQTAFGAAFYVEHAYPREYRRGYLSLGGCLDIAPRGWALLARRPEMAAIDLSRCAFLDTETTGLAGGTGTYPFLVGVGRFTGSDFVVRQFFMRDLDEEEALLAALAEELGACQGLVTFNGKTFDWPLLETRYRMKRLEIPLADPLHLDLLHPARRFYRQRLESCSLASLEAEVLGERRLGDIPGELIPAIYFHYLQSGETAQLADVFYHNRLDILSMAVLAAYLGRLATDPEDLPVQGEELSALGRLYAEEGEVAPAIGWYEAALARGLPEGRRQEALRQLSELYKRLRQHERAVEIWQSLIQGRSFSVYPYVELAKYYEHREKDYHRARQLVRDALGILQTRRALVGDLARQEADDLQHRLARLERKAGRRLF